MGVPSADAIGGCRRCVSPRRMRIGGCRRWVSPRRMPHRRMPTVGVPSADALGGCHPSVGVPSAGATVRVRSANAHRRMPVGGWRVGVPSADALGGCPIGGCLPVAVPSTDGGCHRRRMPTVGVPSVGGGCPQWVSHRMPVGGCRRWVSPQWVPVAVPSADAPSADAHGGCPPSADAISGCPPLGGCTSADASAVGVPSCGGGWMSPPRRTLGRSRGSSLGVESARYCASLLRLVYTRSTKPSDCNSGP